MADEIEKTNALVIEVLSKGFRWSKAGDKMVVMEVECPAEKTPLAAAVMGKPGTPLFLIQKNDEAS